MKQEVVQKLVQAMELSPENVVLVQLWGGDSAREEMHKFTRAIAALGASPLEWQQNRSVNLRLFETADGRAFSEAYFKVLEPVDVILDIFADPPCPLSGEYSDQAVKGYRNYMGRLSQWMQSVAKVIQLRLPTAAPEYAQCLEEAYDIDYHKLKEECGGLIRRLESAQLLQLKTGRDSILKFTVTGRRWYEDTGDGDLPCGEVYIAPVEQETQGSVWFETLYLDGQKYEDVQLWIEDGKVIRSSQTPVQKFLEELPENGRMVCEFGIGMNPRVRELSGEAFLDEKALDTFHIALGDNTMFGGRNEAPLHLDLVGKGVWKAC